MSALFHIRIELAVGPTVWTRFEVCHPDQWDVPATKAIALLVMVEAYREMKDGFGFRPDRPMSAAQAADIVERHPAKVRLEQWSELYGRNDAAAFAAAADEAILDVQLTNEDGNPKQEQGDPHPQATLVFTVRDVATVAHLVGGFRFDSAMCDCSIW